MAGVVISVVDLGVAGAAVFVLALVAVDLVPEGTSDFSLCVFMGVLVMGSLEMVGFRREEIRFPSPVNSDICVREVGYCGFASK